MVVPETRSLRILEETPIVPAGGMPSSMSTLVHAVTVRSAAISSKTFLTRILPEITETVVRF